MKRREFISLASAFALLPGLASAGEFSDNLTVMLQSQGFTSFRLSRTWLGRSRLIAVSSEFRREIVFNPNTGEILRDFLEAIGENGESASGIFDPDDDENDDEDEDDETGGDESDDDDDSDDDGIDNDDDGSDDDDDDDDDEDSSN